MIAQYTALLTLLAVLSITAGRSAGSSAKVWGSSFHTPRLLWSVRGGDSSVSDTKQELTLDEKVNAAMRKLGLTPPSEEDECEGGVCPAPQATKQEEVQQKEVKPQEDPHAIAARMAKDMQVDEAMAMAALGATSDILEGDQRHYNEAAARDMIQQELTFIKQVSVDCEEVKQLVSEGHDEFLTRRALAFAEMNVDDARAILVADQIDAQEEADREAEARAEQEEAEARAQARAEAEKAKAEAAKPLKTVSVKADFDPTAAAASTPTPPQQAPKPAKKSDVVFEATANTVQELILESPVPVLLDVYADWCGPCKALTPVLEEMAIKGGGMFRLVKLNSDNERALSGALEVTALPTVFAIRDGQILHMFQGMPQGEEAMKNFMMGLLMPGASFDPPVTPEEQKKYKELSSKLAKTAGAAGFSFSARERLQDRMATRLDQLVEACNGDMADAEESARVIRSLLSNVIREPFDFKYRRVNLQNKVLSAKVAAYPPSVGILKSLGFVMDSDGSAMVLGANKKVVNVAPLTVARDCIDKWIDKNRHKVAAAQRKHRDDLERKRLAEEAEAVSSEEEEEEEEEVDPDAASIKLRLEGKKKVHDLDLRADDTLYDILDQLPAKLEDGQEVQFTCVAKRLVVKSSEKAAMKKTLRDHGLTPSASIVVRIGGGATTKASSDLKERAAAKKNLKTGSHTMQSIGIYSKDDNAKGELIDGGGGVWYEHDVTDDEEESAEGNEEAESPIDDDDEEEEVDD